MSHTLRQTSISWYLRSGKRPEQVSDYAGVSLHIIRSHYKHQGREMARYYFDLLDDDGLSIDEEGLELPNLRAVQAEAAKALADMALDAVHILEGTTKRFMAIEVRDDFGPVMQVRFSFEVEALKQ